MDCPRCKLISPPTAKRCDCGYDFETKTVDASYSPQGMPKEIRTALVVLVVLNVLFALLVLFTGNAARILAAVVWSAVVWVSYSRLVKRSNGARIALAVLTFPIGTALFLSADTRLFCLQAPDSK